MQIAYTYASSPRGGGHHILFKHPDGSVPPRRGDVLLGIRHAPLDVSGPTVSRPHPWLTKNSFTFTKHIMYNPAGAWPLTFPCSKYRVLLPARIDTLTPTSQLVLF